VRTVGCWRTTLRSAVVASVAAGVALAAGCAPDGASGVARPEQPSRAGVVESYLSGRSAEVFLPAGLVRAPVVVLVPGGSWQSADYTGLRPLAARLADAGSVVVAAGHRAVAAGARFPEPVADVVCSVDFAVDRARRAGVSATSVVVVGHSSGGHLAALAALVGDQFRAGCPYPPSRPDALIGLAGTYDLARFADLAEPLFGGPASADPGRWRRGDPTAWARDPEVAPGLRILLLHGSADPLVPVAVSEAFEQALRAGGHRVELLVLDGVDHSRVYAAGVAGPPIERWLRGRP